MDIGIHPFAQSKTDLSRVAHILNVLVKFRMGGFVRNVQAGERIKVHIFEHENKSLSKVTPPMQARMLLEELGTTFVKFGQTLSTRPDIIGPEYAEEFAKFQDRMKPFPTDQAKSIIKEELGKSVDQLFSSFDPVPVGSATIAQVHRATLKNGDKVVVKVQRPGISITIKEDIRIMHYLAHLADKYIPESRIYDPQYLVNEFERSILKELDFNREVKNAIRLKENFKGVKGIYVPEVYEELSTGKVLVMEEVGGTRLNEIIKSNSKKFDKKLIAKRIADSFFKMVLVDGFYHADLHPGNMMVRKGNVVCFLDFGRMGTLDRELAENMLLIASFTLNGDVNALVEHLTRTGIVGDLVDLKSLKADITDLLDAHHNTRLEEIKIGTLLTDFMVMIRKYEFNRPRETVEISRAILIVDGVVRSLDPKFNAYEEFKPYADKAFAHIFDPSRLTGGISSMLLDIEYLARTFPGALRRFTKKLEDGKIKVELEHKDLTKITADLERIGDKVSTAVVLAALILGSALVISINKPAGLIGFGLSAILSIWFVFKIFVNRNDM